MHGGSCGRFFAVGHGGFDPDPFIPGEAVQNVEEIEPCGSLRIIGGRQVDQIIEISFQLQKFEEGNGRVELADYEVLSEIGGALGDVVSEVFFDLLREITLPRCRRHRRWWLRRRMTSGRGSRGRFGCGHCRLSGGRLFRWGLGWLRLSINRFSAFGFRLVRHARSLRLTQGAGRVKSLQYFNASQAYSAAIRRNQALHNHHVAPPLRRVSRASHRRRSSAESFNLRKYQPPSGLILDKHAREQLPEACSSRRHRSARPLLASPAPRPRADRATKSEASAIPA